MTTNEAFMMIKTVYGYYTMFNLNTGIMIEEEFTLVKELLQAVNEKYTIVRIIPADRIEIEELGYRHKFPRPPKPDPIPTPDPEPKPDPDPDPNPVDPEPTDPNPDEGETTDPGTGEEIINPEPDTPAGTDPDNPTDQNPEPGDNIDPSKEGTTDTEVNENTEGGTTSNE